MELHLLLASVSAGINLAKDALAARDNAKVQAALIDVQGKLFDLSTASLASSEKAFTLHAQLEEVKREKAELQAKLDERGKYVLHELHPGNFCYRAKTSEDGAEPAHNLCQVCYDKGTRVILRYRAAEEGFDALWACAENQKHTINMGGALPANYVVV